MRLRPFQWLIQMGLVLLLTTLPAPLALAEDEYADLRLELVGAPLSATQREITIRVTNISVWWADETKLRVETVSPGAANVMNRDVENLDPGQTVTFKYTLSGACANHVIKAEVTPARNYAGVPEANTANNRIQQAVCPPPPPSGSSSGTAASTRRTGPIEADPVIVTKPLPSEQVLKEHLRPGTHTLEINSSKQVSVGRMKYYNTHLVLTPEYRPIGWRPWVELRDTAQFMVGWAQNEDTWTYPRFRAYQTVIQFDLALIWEVPTKLVSQAVLSWDETPGEWFNEEGHGQDKPGCVASVARPAFDVDFNSVRGLVESEYVNDVPAGSREANVTSYIRERIVFPQGRFPEQINFILRPELEDGDADDDESCLSTVSNVRLHVTYTVPD